MKWRTQITDLEAYVPGKTIDEVKKQFGLDSIVKLASNENPFGYSPKVDEVLKNFHASFTLYPDGYATRLREEMAAFLGVSEKQLIFANGTDELIQIVSRSLLEPGKNTVMAAPTFSQYRHNAVIEGAEVREVPLKGGRHDLDAMLEQIDENTAIVWICSPNNPTGTYTTEKELTAFLDRVPEEVLVFLDEAYGEYVVADDYYDSLQLFRKYSNLIVSRTFSKIYGLASFRVGYGIANEAVIRGLEPVRPPFNTNVLGQMAAMAAIKDQDFIRECREKNRRGLQQFYDFCGRAGLFYYPSQTNFILIDFKCDSDKVFQFLLRHGYIVRSGKPLGFPTSVRVTVGTEEQNNGVIQKMGAFLKELPSVLQ
ncbi:histidinol-phosphate aminotransferase [Weizmannia acidilactici]|uniref:Histidinol-phosphate aminotransferase n=1 Tax=Weizmannia acidilactici TaxID=2607726 RepID=A0A5J4JLM7_9BACI|nr:histidinol-phosphate transaminase [Weizmannia acidilactici]GER66019.1 histidinol-phosphate aminotransferase [Weizmannia acidilactici]GER71605.1 histidinol-phosphate aminotransferase [Weizmannia acidilactici]GER74938.1 histidinol-phosphate aminotransferase [Weizmannia acidilactici]